MAAKGKPIGGAQGKGQPIGGASPRRGMLPPTGSGPVEVTPEWMLEQQRAAGQSAGSAAPTGVDQVPAQKTQDPAHPSQAPAADLPDPNSEPGDQLVMCERAIHEAKARWKAKVDGANEEFIDEAGPFLAWVHEHKLYKLMQGNDGKPYRSFARYLKEQHDLTRRTGYRITQTIPLLRILSRGGYSLPDLSSRQVDALHPVRTQYSEVQVLKVWGTASLTMKGTVPTPEELEKAKQLLGLVTKPDTDEDLDALPSAADPGAAVERAAKLLVPETVREAVRKDPDRVRLLYQVLGSALTEAGVRVD